MSKDKKTSAEKFYSERILWCPVCEKTVFEYWSDFAQCDICGWYNDGIQYKNHDYEGGCNKKSVNQLKEEWEIKKLKMQKDYGIKLQYLGKPFTGHVLTVYISEDESVKEKAVQTIERFKWLISINAFAALIYEFENGDVLEYCGGKDYFILEYIKMVGETPNIRRIRMNSRKALKGMYGHYYGDDYHEVIENDVVSSSLMSELIVYTINSDKSNWLQFLDSMYEKYDLHADSYTMTSKGFTKISIKDSAGGGFLCDDCAEVIFVPKCSVCKRRPFLKCGYYADSQKHIRYKGVVNCEGFEEDENSLSYKQYKELKDKNS